MSILILADHDNGQLAAATLNTVTAATQVGGDIHVLVAGDASGDVAKAAAAIAGVSKVLTAGADAMAHGIAENIAPLIQSMASGYNHLMAPATTTGKNIMPRVAALLDVMQVSDIIKVESADTFQRPIYAGNAIATVTSNEAVKVVTVRSTAGAMHGILVREYAIKPGAALMYYPEANVLVPTAVDPASKTPCFKSIPITLQLEPDTAHQPPTAAARCPSHELTSSCWALHHREAASHELFCQP